MGAAVACLNAFECSHFGQDDGQQAATAQFDEADAGRRRHHDLVQLVDDAFLRDNLDALGVAAEGFRCLFLNLEVQLSGETDAPHHAQRVVAEGDVGVERRGDDAVLKVEQPVEEVNQFAVAVVVEADCERIDSEVAAMQVVVERPVFHDRLPAVPLVALAPCADELNLLVVPLELRRAEVAEDADVSAPPHVLGEGLGKADARTGSQPPSNLPPRREAFFAKLAVSVSPLLLGGGDGGGGCYHHIDVLRRPLQDDVPHVAAYDVAFQAQRVGLLPDATQQRVVDEALRICPASVLAEAVVFLYGVN